MSSILQKNRNQNQAEPQSLQPKQEKVHLGTPVCFMPEAKDTYKETCVDEKLHKTRKEKVFF